MECGIILIKPRSLFAKKPQLTSIDLGLIESDLLDLDPMAVIDSRDLGDGAVPWRTAWLWLG